MNHFRMPCECGETVYFEIPIGNLLEEPIVNVTHGENREHSFTGRVGQNGAGQIIIVMEGIPDGTSFIMTAGRVTGPWIDAVHAREMNTPLPSP